MSNETFYEALDRKERENRIARIANRPDNLHDYQGCADDLARQNAAESLPVVDYRSRTRDHEGSSLPIQHPLPCPTCKAPIFVRGNGNVVSHYNGDGDRCSANETPMPCDCWKHEMQVCDICQGVESLPVEATQEYPCCQRCLSPVVWNRNGYVHKDNGKCEKAKEVVYDAWGKAGRLVPKLTLSTPSEPDLLDKPSDSIKYPSSTALHASICDLIDRTLSCTSGLSFGECLEEIKRRLKK